MKLHDLKIHFLGDSITEGIGASDLQKCYVSCFARNTGALCRNYGISGTRIARKRVPSENLQWDLDFPSRVPQMAEDADIIVVFGGTNDYGHGDAPLGQMSDRTAWSFYGGLHTLCDALAERYPDARIVILTPLHRQEENERTPGLSAFVHAIRAVAESRKLPVLDLYDTSAIQPDAPGGIRQYLPDGLHPNDFGHRLIAEHLEAFLAAL